jgi:hypothetical protein
VNLSIIPQKKVLEVLESSNYSASALFNVVRLQQLSDCEIESDTKFDVVKLECLEASG